MTECEQVLTASYDMSDEPMELSEVDGLKEAVDRIAEQQSGKELVRCPDRIMDYDVYWNDKTETVRFAAVAMNASYEVPEEYHNE